MKKTETLSDLISEVKRESGASALTKEEIIELMKIRELSNLSEAIYCLGNGDAATHMGGMELLGLSIKEGLEELSNSIKVLNDSVVNKD